MIECQRDSRRDDYYASPGITATTQPRSQLKEKTLAGSSRHADHKPATGGLGEQSTHCRFLSIALVAQVRRQTEKNPVGGGRLECPPAGSFKLKSRLET